MVAAALKRQAKRFIHTSSMAAYGHHQQRIDEQTQSNAIHSPINYHRTKYLAEMEVRKGIEMVTDQILCNSQKAVKELDYHSVSLRDMLDDCHQWMLSEGLIGK
jgi:nucleoside-diphosphate-sugar epimerase